MSEGAGSGAEDLLRCPRRAFSAGGRLGGAAKSDLGSSSRGGLALRLGTVVVLTALSLLGTPALAAEAVTECDRLAAGPDDPKRVAPAVYDDAVDGKAAEAACRKALKASPDVARFRYQLGRALEAEEDYDAAMAAYEQAFDNGYAAAADAEGMLFDYGLGREIDYDKAAELYQRALDAGDLFAAGRPRRAA